MFHLIAAYQLFVLFEAYVWAIYEYMSNECALAF